MSRTVAALLLAALVACGKSPADHLSAAQDQLAAGAYDKALAEVQAGLSGNPSDKALQWRLELAGLEARARSGDKAGVLSTLDRLAGQWPKQVNGKLYASTADQLKAAGDPAGAIEVLDAGLKRFPGDADLTKAIEQAKGSGSGDELEMLKTLGYIGD